MTVQLTSRNYDATSALDYGAGAQWSLGHSNVPYVREDLINGRSMLAGQEAGTVNLQTTLISTTRLNGRIGPHGYVTARDTKLKEGQVF